MKQTSDLYLAIIGIGCLCPVGILAIGLLALRGGQSYFGIFDCVIANIILAFPLSLLGVLIGKQLTNMGMGGACMGAMVVVLIGIFSGFLQIIHPCVYPHSF